jgi:prophage regulatory protein
MNAQTQATNSQKMEVSQAFNDRLLRRPEVENKTGLSRSAIYEGIKSGSFPEPVPISNNAVAWLCSEVDEWINQRIAMRANKSRVQYMKA